MKILIIPILVILGGCVTDNNLARIDPFGPFVPKLSQCEQLKQAAIKQLTTQNPFQAGADTMSSQASILAGGAPIQFDRAGERSSNLIKAIEISNINCEK